VPHLGGIAIDSWGRTNLHRLYAIGEAAAPLHGARRRGGNAFSECVVFGARAGRAAADLARQDGRTLLPFDRSVVEERIAQITSWHRPATPDGEPADIRKRIQATMWQNAGPLRTNERLDQCLLDLQDADERRLAMHARTPFEIKAAVEIDYMLEVAVLIARCAQFRTESRGAHFRADFPDLDNENWLCQLVCRQGAPPQKRPIDVTRIQLPHPAEANGTLAPA
jgi:fumarate reductase (CoM/CoB) subunit A